MYQSYFRMKHRPFAANPQVDNYFPAAAHEEALATLSYCITEGRGVGLLTGTPGTGKTLICQRLRKSLEPTFSTAMLTHTNFSNAKGMLQAILYKLTLPYHGMDEQELRLTLNDYLLGKYAQGARVVLVIDEAQNLSLPMLEEIRMLSNLEADRQLFQVILVGQSRLNSLLRDPELLGLNQRIGARAMVTALNDEETAAYIRHQMARSGVIPEEIITEEAMAAVYEATLGIPRLINQLCEHALLITYVADAKCIDANTIEEASADLNRLNESPTPNNSHRTGQLDSNTLPTIKLTQSREIESTDERHYEEVEIELGEANALHELISRTKRFPVVAPTDDVFAADAAETIDSVEDEDVFSPRPDAIKAAGVEAATSTENWISTDQTLDDPAYDLVLDESALESVGIAQDIEPAQIEPETIPAASPTTNTKVHPLDEYFAQEEIIVDQYAALDASRAGPARSVEPQLTKPAKPLKPAPAVLPVLEQSPAVVPCVAKSCGTSAPECPKTSASVTFVDASDNPATLEIGAGVPQETPAEPPILLIENRMPIIEANIIRLDSAQTPTGGTTGGYRRLFSHAKKG